MAGGMYRRGVHFSRRLASFAAFVVVLVLFVGVGCRGGGQGGLGGPAPSSDQASKRTVAAYQQGEDGPQPTPDRNVVVFDHASCTANTEPNSLACTPAYALELEDGEPFRVLVRNTNPDAFEYGITGIRRLETKDTVLQMTPQEPRVDHWLAHVHDARFGGYLVSLTKTGTSSLGSATLIIRVKTKEWRVDFGGAFAFRWPTDPAFEVVPGVVGTDSTGQDSMGLVFQKDDQRADETATDVVTFAHVYHNSWPGWAPSLSFGLSVDPSGPGAYYLGGAWRFGDQASLVMGGALATVSAPPSGVALDGPVDDANVLNNLGERRRWSLFLGISFAFLGGGQDALNKPFQGQEAAPRQEHQGRPSPQGPANLVSAQIEPVDNEPLQAVLTVRVTTGDGRQAGIGQVALAWPQDGDVQFASFAAARAATDDDGNGAATVTFTQPSDSPVDFAVEVASAPPSACKFTVAWSEEKIDFASSSAVCEPPAPVP